jgi:hypothetical protein
VLEDEALDTEVGQVYIQVLQPPSPLSLSPPPHSGPDDWDLPDKTFTLLRPEAFPVLSDSGISWITNINFLCNIFL